MDGLEFKQSAPKEVRGRREGSFLGRVGQQLSRLKTLYNLVKEFRSQILLQERDQVLAQLPIKS